MISQIASPRSLNPSIFREYDIRGIAGQDLTAEATTAIGQAFGSLLGAEGRSRLAVGRDCRLSSDWLAEALFAGLTAAGCRVTDIGMSTTPILYWSLHKLQQEGGVMITGSHNPSEYNGFKLCRGTDTLYGEQIQEVRRIIESGRLSRGEGSVERRQLTADYIAELAASFRFPRRLRVVVDAGSGTAGMVAPELYRRLGCEVVELYCEVDGRFPHHHPDPTVVENLADLRQRVVAERADLGLAFDGDADRIGVIDEQGGIIWGDKLLILFSREILSRRPGATIISEVKASTTLYEDIERHGGRPLMWKTGHSLMKAKMKEEQAALAGELSGHMFFADRYYGFDDAIYAGCRLLEILAAAGRPLTSLLADVPQTVSTPEIRVDCPDEEKFALVERLKAHFRASQRIINVDGVRIVFPDGWALVRASNTQPVLVLRFEAQTAERVAELKSMVEEAIARLR